MRVRQCAARRALLAQLAIRGSRGRRLGTSTVVDIAASSDLGGQVSEEGNVLFVKKKVPWKALSLPADRPVVPTQNLFCGSNSPLRHTEEDVGKFFQYDGSTSAFSGVFYHTGFCGSDKMSKKLRTNATMVRRPGLQLRDQLLQLEQTGGLAAHPGFVLSGDQGVGKSCILNYAIATCQEAGWLVVNIPWAADWTLGIDARDPRWPNEAYRVADDEIFKQRPPELHESTLYDNPEASTHLLISTYLSQRPKLERIAIKCPERRAVYMEHARDKESGPTLADVLALVSTDTYDAFSDFPIPLRPIHDFLAELKTATELPVLLVIDSWNTWDFCCSSLAWQERNPLHAQQMLVPHHLSSANDFGGQMQNGTTLCALSWSAPFAPKLTSAMRFNWPPPPNWREPASLPDRLRSRLVEVPRYSSAELQQCLDFYAHIGHLRNRRLEPQLRSGELRRKVALLTGRVPADVCRACEAMP